ncbi:polygalacturonase QRT3, partial [Thalictrum thalictroides]
MRAPIAVLCVFLVIFCQEAFCSFSPPSSKSREYYAKFKNIIAAKSKPLVNLQANGLKQDGRVFYPIGYGADPTGAKDSSAAILNALADAFKVSSGLELLRGVHDLGGAVIDLQGASYKIDHPIRLPAQGGGNVV